MDLENLIFGGKSWQRQKAKNNVYFNPNMGNGGNFNMMGNIGGGSVNQNGTSSSTGGSFSFTLQGLPINGTKLELQDLFLGGKSDLYQNYQKNVDFSPYYGRGGGTFNMQGDIGGGNANQNATSISNGAALDFKFTAMPGMKLEMQDLIFGNGGNINMMGNIGGGFLNQGGSTNATGAGFDFKFSGIPVMLEDLATDIGHFHADKGSDTYFDYRKGDPLAASNIGKLSKSAGGNIHFKGATGRQENGVVDKFRDSSRGALNASGSDRKARGTAMADHASVLGDKSNALKHMSRDNQRLVLIL